MKPKVKRHSNPFFVFIGIIAITTGTLLLVIQSKYFAGILKNVAQTHMPADFGIEGNFKELEVRFFPPGIIIKNPSVILRSNNIAHLPGGTALSADSFDINFRFVQLLTGAVTINTFVINGASLKLKLDESFFNKLEKQGVSKEKKHFLSWESLIRFQFHSVSLLNSKLDIGIERAGQRIHLQTFAKEFTLSETERWFSSYELSMDFQKTYLETPIISHSISHLQASMGGSQREVTLRSFGIQEGGMSVSMNGTIHGNLLNPEKLKSDLQYLIKGPVEEWLDPHLFGSFIPPMVILKKRPITGNLTVEGRLTADLMSFKQTLETRATAQISKLTFADWQVDQAKIHGFWKPSQAGIESADFKMGDGDLQISQMTYPFESPRTQTTVHFQNIDFRKIMGSFLHSVYPLHMQISGDAHLDILFPTKRTGLGIKGISDFNLKNFSFDNQDPDKQKPLKVLIATSQVSLKSKFAIDSQGVRFEQARVALPQSQLEARGTVDEKNGFNLDILGQVHLADIDKLSIFKITGDGPLHWTITGKKPDVFFTFDSDLKNASYLNLDLGHTKGKIIWDDAHDTLSFENFKATQGRTDLTANGAINLGDKDNIDLTVQVPHGTIQDFAVIFSEFIDQSVPWYPEDLSGQIKGVIKVTGQTDTKLLSAMGDMEVSNIDYKNELFRYGHLQVGYRRGSYVAENVNIQKKTGWLRGNIIFSDSGFLKFDGRSDGMSTLDIDRLTIWDIPYRAPIHLEMDGSGKLENLHGSLKLSIDAGTIKNHPIEPSAIECKIENKNLRGTFSIFNKKATAKFDYGLEKYKINSFDFKAAKFDFSPLLFLLNPNLADDFTLHSNMEGNALLQFKSKELSLFTGFFNLRAFELSRLGYSLALTQPVHVEVKDGNYRFDKVKLKGEETDLNLKGLSENGRVKNDLTGLMNLSLLEFFVPQIAFIHGIAQIKAQLYGQVDKPHIKANLNIKDMDFRLQTVDQPFEDLQAQVLWEDTSVTLDGLQTKFADGQITGHGVLHWVTYGAPQADFQFLLDNPKIKFYPVSYARTSGKLMIKGSELPYKVTGNLKIAEALIKENFNLSEGSRLLRSSKFFPSSGTGEFQAFDLDVNLNADQGIFIRNDLFDAELKINLEVVHSPDAPILLGSVYVLHGKLFFKNNYFWIQSGSLRFNNPSVLDPEFDLTGQTEMKGYKVILVGSGKVSDYRLTFESQPPLSQNDIVSLLTLGVTSSGYQSISVQNRDAYSRDEMYSLLFSQSGINKGFEEKLGVKLRVDQSQMILPENVFRARSNADINGTVSPKVVMQKDLTYNLNASAGTTVGVGDSREQDVNLEYNIGRYWSLLGIYEDQRGIQPDETRTSVGADFKFKLRFK